MKFNKNMLLLYAVTDSAWVGKLSLCEQIEAAIKGGATMIQLREKNLSYDVFLSEAISTKEICKKYNVPLIINDNVKIAIKSDADGVHVGIEDTPVSVIRRIVPPDFIIGATAKTVEQALTAESSGADYIGVGAVFPSPTKKNAIRITTDKLREICTSVNIPAVAIGGISKENVHELVGGGIDGVAVVSAIFSADDIQKSTKQLKAEVKKVIKS